MNSETKILRYLFFFTRPFNAFYIKVFIRISFIQFETKSGVPDELKEATKKWQTDVETYSKSLPESLSPEKFTEKFQKSLNYITEQSTNLWKKAQGNPEFEKDIQDFTKTHIGALLAKVESVKVNH